MPLCAGMHNARWKQGKSLDERREFRRFFLGKVLDKKQSYRHFLMTTMTSMYVPEFCSMKRYIEPEK